MGISDKNMKILYCHKRVQLWSSLNQPDLCQCYEGFTDYKGYILYRTEQVFELNLLQKNDSRFFQ